MERGFTLVETIVAVGIITVALVGILGLLATSVSLGEDIRSRHIAANLAQEGIEVVHNIRSTNWIEQQTSPATPWDDGLTDGDACVAYDSAALISPCGDSTLLFDEAIGRYTHATGEATRFSRTVTLSHETDEDGFTFIRVISAVAWDGNTITAEEHLYDWK